MRLNGKTAIITGAGSGLGRMIAIHIAKEGAMVIVNDLNNECAQKVADEIEKDGGTAIAIKTDIFIQTEIAAMLKEAIEKFGKIDILVNNAGITRHRDFLEMGDEDWDPVLQTDLKGTFYCSQAVAPFMMKQHYGKIINISSTAGMGVTPNFGGNFNYVAAKAGVNLMTKMIAYELGPHGINVNCVAPGFILTSELGITATRRSPEEVKAHMEYRKSVTCLKKVGTPEDVANAVVFLASDEASFITGQILCVDGGRTDHL
jgi:3-oxoacyl-[acyl-carrier protein] reductase